MNRDEARAAYGPYFDVNTRTDRLGEDRDSSARLCAKKVLAGDTAGARYWAEQYAAEDAELGRVLAWAMAGDKRGDAAWLIGMHHDYGPVTKRSAQLAADRVAREVTDGPEPA
jgi:hypothetical protein